MVSGSSTADPYFVTETQGYDNSNVATKTQIDSRAATGSKHLVLLTFGQSNSVNVAATAFTAVNDKIYQVNLLNGGMYLATDPLLGVTTGAGPGNYALRLADKFRTAAIADRVTILPFAASGASAADWAVGGKYNHRIGVASRRLAAVGLTASALLWQQGETDTTLATSQVSYAASLTSIIATVRTFWSSSVPMFVAKTSYTNGTTSANVTNAQVAAVDHPNGIWAGPDTDSLNATNRGADNLHWNDTGSDAFATLTKTAMGLFGTPFV